MKSLMALMLLITTGAAHALTNSTYADAPEWSPVIQIKSEAPDSTGDTTPAYCNATFIARNILVTAAHCVKLAYISKNNLLDMQTGFYKYITKADGTTVRIGYVKKDQFNKHVNIELPKTLADKIASRGEKATIGPDEDFALLWWNEETPEISSMKFAEAVTPSEHAVITKNLKDHALKVVSINFFSEMSTDSKRMADLNNYKWNNGHVYSKSTSRVEEGDSGSPLFVKINNKYKVFAVVKGKASTVFANWDVYPSVQNHLCELNKRMPTDMKLKECF